MAQSMIDPARELKDPVLVMQVTRTAMNELQNAVNHGRNIPMSEFVKILLWEKENLSKIYQREELLAEKSGSKFKDRKWCGVPAAEFEIPSLGIYKKA